MKKKAADSFSGIPAIVLGKSWGKTDKKKQAISAIIFGYVLSLKLSQKIVLTKKKNATTVKANITTGKITAA